jgi:hypothetical protein
LGSKGLGGGLVNVWQSFGRRFAYVDFGFSSFGKINFEQPPNPNIFDIIPIHIHIILYKYGRVL